MSVRKKTEQGGGSDRKAIDVNRRLSMTVSYTTSRLAR